MTKKPRLEIHYCPGCRWLTRAAWMAQEVLITFEAELGEVALVPGASGVFDVRVRDVLLWSRSRDGGFPELKVLKQKIRDVVSPNKALGHSDSQI